MPTAGRRTATQLVAGLVCALALTGCGTSSGESSSGSASPSATVTTGSTTPTPTEPAATGRPADGPLITGTGYRFRAPKGWRDVTAKVHRRGLDRAAGARLPVAGFASNVNVVLDPHGFVSGNLAAVTRQIQTELRPTAPHYRVLPPTELDGEPAGHLAGLRSEVGHPYWLEQYVVTHGDRGYIISFSFSPKLAEHKRARLIDSILASWHWT